MASGNNEWVFATTNSGKVVEARGVAAEFGVRLLPLNELRIPGVMPSVSEGCDTYEGNAILKAERYAEWSGRVCVADDSGIEIAAIGMLPGVYTARFGYERVREMLLGVGAADLAAEFICCMAYAEPSGRRVAVTARLPGRLDLLLQPPTGVTLPFSYLFVPHGSASCLADLLSRGAILSHRGLAMRALCRALLDPFSLNAPVVYQG
jgi:XTP/dITP diphosphohydrolase